MASLDKIIENEIKKSKLSDILNKNEKFFLKITEVVRKKYKKESELTDLNIYNMISEKLYLFLGEETNLMNLYRDRKQVEKLKNTVQYEQRTPIWYKIRKNLITATNVAGIIGSSKYDKRSDLLKKKLGMGKAFVSNFATEHGKCYEDVAIQMYERRKNVKIHEFGLLKHEKINFLGASPDGITDDGIMVEIKCPVSREINGNVYDLKTTCYFIQMQTQLEVCDLNICDFLECKLIDYEDKDHFMEDSGDSLFGSNGLEKGVVGCMTEKLTDEKTYFIPPFELTLNEKLEAISDFHKKNKKTHNIQDNKYWNLKLYSVVRVKRDKEFFRKILPALEDFWSEVLELRNNTDLYEERYNPEKTIMKENPGLIKYTFGGFDSDED